MKQLFPPKFFNCAIWKQNTDHGVIRVWLPATASVVKMDNSSVPANKFFWQSFIGSAHYSNKITCLEWSFSTFVHLNSSRDASDNGRGPRNLNILCREEIEAAVGFYLWYVYFLDALSVIRFHICGILPRWILQPIQPALLAVNDKGVLCSMISGTKKCFGMTIKSETSKFFKS